MLYVITTPGLRLMEQLLSGTWLGRAENLADHNWFLELLLTFHFTQSSPVVNLDHKEVGNTECICDQ